MLYNRVSGASFSLITGKSLFSATFRKSPKSPPADAPGCEPWGGSRHSLLRAGDGGLPARSPLRDRIRISIRSLHQATVFRIDSRHLPLACLDIEGPTGAHLHAPHMGAPRCERGGDDRPHPVSRFETPDLLLASPITRREGMPR